MTREETVKILMAIQAAYPNFKVPDKTIAVDTWHMALSDYTYKEISIALNIYIRSDTSGFAPNIGQIIDKTQFLSQQNDLNEMEAWEKIFKAIKNSGYNSEEEFSRLPPILQKIVVSPGALKEMALAEVNDNTISGWKREYIAAYKKALTAEKEVRKLGDNFMKSIGFGKDVEISESNVPKLTAAEERAEFVKGSVPMTSNAKNRLQKILESKE